LQFFSQGVRQTLNRVQSYWHLHMYSLLMLAPSLVPFSSSTAQEPGNEASLSHDDEGLYLHVCTIHS